MVRARNRTPSLKVAAFDDDVDDYDDASISNLNANSSSKEDTGKEQGGVVRGLAFDGDSSADDGDDDDSSVSSIDSSSSDDDDDDGSELRLEEVKPFDVDKGSSSSLRLGRSRSVHFDLAASGTPSRQSRESANGGDDGEGSDSARAADARRARRQQRQQQRRSPLSAFAEGEMWLASSTRLSTVGLRKRDVIHDDLFYICFDEVCQTAIHKQMQRRRRGRAASTQSTFETDREKERERERQQATGPAVAMAVAGDGNGRGNGPGRTRSRSTPEMIMSEHARDDITGDGNSDGDGPAAVRARAWEEEKKEEKGSRGMIAAGVRVASAKGRGEQDAAAGSGDDAAPPPPKRPGGAWVPPHRRRRNVSVSFADDSKKPAAVT